MPAFPGFILDGALAGLTGSPGWTVNTTLTTGGVTFATPEAVGIKRVERYVGERNVPAEVQRRRRTVFDMMKRMGTPVLVKHRFNIGDVEQGIAVPSQNYDGIYKQTRARDPISHGVGYCSVELSDDEWITPDGSSIVVSTTSPGPDYQRAPRYRGYGPGYLIYVIMPDAALDVWRLSEGGALLKVQNAQVFAPWYPFLSDDDLLMQVELDVDGNIVKVVEHYELKDKNPVTIRGRDRKGRREQLLDGGNRFVVNQVFEMARIPEKDPVYQVEVDR